MNIAMSASATATVTLRSPERAPFVSVIVPTYNRGDMLDVTIGSFVNQNYSADSYEIVVVDNNSSDHTREIVKRWQERSRVPISYIFEARQGVHFARNTAFKHAVGEILYYTDDDMIAEADLLSEIVKPFFYDARIAVVTGRVLPKWQKEPPPWVLELCQNSLLSLQMRPEHFVISSQNVGVASCHQAIRREAFADAGGFNPENTAGEWVGDGETGLNLKMMELGYLFAFTNSAVIHHMIPPQRMTQEYLNSRLANQGNCDSYTDYRRHRYSRGQLLKRIALHMKALCGELLRCVVKRCLNKTYWRIHRASIDYRRNRIFYDWRLLTDEKWRRMVVKTNWLSEN